MAEANNDANNPNAEDSNKGQPAEQQGASSEKPQIDSAEKARRDQQSKKDKAQEENNQLREDVEYLRARDAEKARDEYVNQLVSDKDKYPNVDPNDKMFKYATSKEEVEEIAKDLQNRYTDVQQKALMDVQEQPETLTDEQIEEKTTELEKEVNETGHSRFGAFVDTISRRKR